MSSMMMRRKMMVRAASGLPAAYQRVEYIESSGTQYIDTGVIFNTGIKINAMMAYVSFASSQTLFGARTTTGSTRFYVTYYNGLDFAYGADHTLNGYSVAANKIAAITYDTTDIPTFKYGVTDTMSSLTIGTPVNPNTTGYIFAYHRASDNTANGFSKSRFYSMTITDANDKMLFDGIPCIRIMDSKPGIYDLVNRRFLTNAGTGEFTVGPEVFGGWKKIVYTATADTLKGNYTTQAIKAVIPSGYRYAVAIADEISNHEENEFIACAFIPNVTYVLGFRWNSDDYSVSGSIANSSTDVILRAGNSVTIWYRTEPLENDMPTSAWNYYCLKPGATEKANELSATFAAVGTYSAMLSVLDWDYSTPPDADGTFVASATKNNGSYSGSFIRRINGSYGSGASWLASIALTTDSTAKIACFYI